MSGPIRMKMEDKEFRLLIFFIVESMMGWLGAQLRFVLFLFLYLAAKAGQIIDSGQIPPASLAVLMTWCVCSRLTSHPFSPLRRSRTHRGRIEGVVVVAVVKAPSKQWWWCEALTQPASALRRCLCVLTVLTILLNCASRRSYPSLVSLPPGRLRRVG